MYKNGIENGKTPPSIPSIFAKSQDFVGWRLVLLKELKQRIAFGQSFDCLQDIIVRKFFLDNVIITVSGKYKRIGPSVINY